MRSTRSPAVNARTLVAALLLAMGGTLPVFLLGALAVQVTSELGSVSSGLGLGAMVSAFFVATGVTSVPAGRRVDLLGWRKSAMIAAIANVGVLLGIAVFARSWTTLFPLMLGAGVVNAIARPTSNRALAQEVAVHRQATTFGLLQSAMPFAGLLAGLSIPSIALTIGWRWTFIVAALVPLLLLAIRRPTPRADASPPPPDNTTDLPGPVRKPISVVYVISITIVAATAVTSLMTFLVISAVAVGISEAAAGLLLAAGNAVAIAVRVLVGWLTDRRRSDGVAAIGCLLAGGGAGAMLMATGSVELFVVGAILAFGAGTGWPGLLFFAVVRQSGLQPALATSRAQMGLAVGAIAAPLMFGTITEHASHLHAWMTVGSIFLIGSLLAFSAKGWADIRAGARQGIRLTMALLARQFSDR